ncbi:MAG: phytanoyl-CoA dioxygenase family protein [Pseudomonadota bacterium]|nr:phytanoyl-CoA dioxygenase family protein [Pseudomonadota bacterium]
MLTKDDTQFFNHHGFLHIPSVFTPEETLELTTELDWLIGSWAGRSPGWSGDWRQVYMDPDTEKKSELVAMHDLYFYSEAWMRAVTHPQLTSAMSQLIGPNVEVHHSTMHVKPPETGHPFPMHQDWAFYQHEDGRYIDVLVHLDDTHAENGEIRFLDGSHKEGARPHVTTNASGPCTPHLPTDQYRLTDTVPVPAKAGDVVCFSIHSVHGSYINQTQRNRRIVRIGYRDPDNRQTAGQSMGRPGMMVKGRRHREPEQPLFSINGPHISGKMKSA